MDENEKIAKDAVKYSRRSFSDFVRNSTRHEKEKVFKKVMEQSNEDQRKILGL